MDQYFRTYYQRLTLFSALVLVIVLIAILFRSHFTEWRRIQTEYKRLLVKIADTETTKRSARRFKPHIQQVLLPDLNRTDRCITCHIGITDQRLAKATLPFRLHSTTLLDSHPVDEFGCTICHQGQGRAVDSRNAHARHPKARWPHSLTPVEHMQSSCGQCHLTIFSNSSLIPGTERFRHGQTLFHREGCLGCHKARNVGGMIGPDLSEQGEKTYHEYPFANIRGERTVSNWLYEHFKDPEMVSPGSQMLAIDLADDELDALVTFTMGLIQPDIPLDYFSSETIQELKGDRPELKGSRLFPMLCSACHGKNGGGKDYSEYEMGVPALFNTDFLAVASSDFIEFTLWFGRNRREMAAWTPRFSGLFDAELAHLSQFVKQQQSFIANGKTDRKAGNGTRGKSVFLKHCSMCHGDGGNEARIISLQNESFLDAADDTFIYQTLIHGRRNTAMPSWRRLSSQDLADLVTFVRNWQRTADRPRRYSLPDGDAEAGEQLYHYRCSRCHGTYGQGDSGPAIRNRDFLAAASNDYLTAMITEGRHNTAMFGWSRDVARIDQLSYQNIADIIVYLREFSKERQEIIYPGSNLGRFSAGHTLFQNNCSDCHGKSGKGPKAPALNNQELLNSASNGYFYATLALGRGGKAMPSWGRGEASFEKLSIQERYDIVAFIRRWQQIVIKKPKSEGS